MQQQFDQLGLASPNSSASGRTRGRITESDFKSAKQQDYASYERKQNNAVTGGKIASNAIRTNLMKKLL